MVPTVHGKESRYVECGYTNWKATAVSSEQCCLQLFCFQLEFYLALDKQNYRIQTGVFERLQPHLRCSVA